MEMSSSRSVQIIRVACALIELDEQILIAQRPKGKALAGKWEFPGGKLEPNESPENCLIREISEELGCLVRVMQALTPVVHHYESFSIELLPFLCLIDEGEPQAMEHSVIQWLDLAQLLKHDLAEADIPIAREYLALREPQHG